MKTIIITAPDDLSEWVEAEAKNGNCSSASDYWCGLARQQREQKSAMLASREQMVVGINSGTSPRSYDEIIEQARRQADSLGFAHE